MKAAPWPAPSSSAARRCARAPVIRAVPVSSHSDGQQDHRQPPRRGGEPGAQAGEQQHEGRHPAQHRHRRQRVAPILAAAVEVEDHRRDPPAAQGRAPLRRLRSLLRRQAHGSMRRFGGVGGSGGRIALWGCGIALDLGRWRRGHRVGRRDRSGLRLGGRSGCDPGGLVRRRLRRDPGGLVGGGCAATQAVSSGGVPATGAGSGLASPPGSASLGPGGVAEGLGGGAAAAGSTAGGGSAASSGDADAAVASVAAGDGTGGSGVASVAGRGRVMASVGAASAAVGVSAAPRSRPPPPTRGASRPRSVRPSPSPPTRGAPRPRSAPPQTPPPAWGAP